jgi:fibronectin-binding autotransporter adhesin
MGSRRALSFCAGHLGHGAAGFIASVASGLVGCSLIVPAVPASAQTLITSNTTISGTINGNDAAGYFVASGTLTVNNATLENFTTTGGSGSGGGLGAGGAVFVASGATAIFNNTSFSGDTAVGGIGGTSSLTGGVLNNGNFASYSSSAFGSTGATPPAAQDNGIIFGSGFGVGFSGGNGGLGGNGTPGFGGAGGAGQVGTAGWSINPLAIANVALATQGVVVAGGDVALTILANSSASALLARIIRRM